MLSKLSQLCFAQSIIKLCSYAYFNSPAWWRHQMETCSALLTICAGNSPVTGEFPAQRPVTRSFDVFVDLRLNELLKQWWGWWFESPSRHFDVTVMGFHQIRFLVHKGHLTPLYLVLLTETSCFGRGEITKSIVYVGYDYSTLCGYFVSSGLFLSPYWYFI